ncbi:hypothetical protein K1719_037422 [Acacia pycnantha]|nr:hypothetical protein K1719_037422 [Acacia pycnantha]
MKRRTEEFCFIDLVLQLKIKMQNNNDETISVPHEESTMAAVMDSYNGPDKYATHPTNLARLPDFQFGSNPENVALQVGSAEKSHQVLDGLRITYGRSFGDSLFKGRLKPSRG